MMSDEGGSLCAHLADLLAPIGRLRWRRFFGGQALLVGEQQVAMVMQGAFYLRTDEALAAELHALGGRAFSYRKRGGEIQVTRYYGVPAERLDDADALCGWVRRAVVIEREWRAAKQAKASARKPRAAKAPKARAKKPTPAGKQKAAPARSKKAPPARAKKSPSGRAKKPPSARAKRAAQARGRKGTTAS
jgi:DNA transformation protein